MSAWSDLVAAFSPAAWFRLGEASGSFADSSGNGYVGTAVTTGHLTRAATGLIVNDSDKAVSCDGTTGNYVSTTYVFNPVLDWTALIWAKTSDATNRVLVAQSDSGGTGRSLIQTNVAGNGYASSNESGTETTGAPAISDGAPHMVVVTYVALTNTLTVYTDGVQVAQATRTPGADAGTIRLGAAKGAAGNTAWNGTYDEAAFWQSALSPATILLLYQAGEGQYETVTPTGIVSGEAFGVAALVRLMAPTGIGSAAAVGTPGLVRLLEASGVASAESFGHPDALRTLAASGIITAETFGTADLLRVLSAAGIPSEELVGTHDLIYWAPILGGYVVLTDGLLYAVLTTDEQGQVVVVSDNLLGWAATSDGPQ